MLLLKINEYSNTKVNKNLIDTLKTVKYNQNTSNNNHILLHIKKFDYYIYLTDTLYNFVIYSLLKCYSFICEDESQDYDVKYNQLIDILFEYTDNDGQKIESVVYVNCESIMNVLNSLNKFEILCCNQRLTRIYTYYIHKKLDILQAIHSIYNYFGLPDNTIKELLYKIDLNEQSITLNDLKYSCANMNLKLPILVQMLILYSNEVNYDYKSQNKFLNYLITTIEQEEYENESSRNKTFYLNNYDQASEFEDRSRVTFAQSPVSSITEKMDIDCSDSNTCTNTEEIDAIDMQNRLCELIVKNFEQKQHEELIIKTKNLNLNKQQYDNMLTNEFIDSKLTLQFNTNVITISQKIDFVCDLLYELVKISNINNMEILIKKFFSHQFIYNERLRILIRFLIKYEFKFDNYYLIEMFVDLYVRLDQQLISKQINFEQDELIFGKREYDISNKIQTFFILLLTHQANWSLLDDCVHRLLDKNKKRNFKLNSKIVLDFLWSLIHIPTLWRGMQSTTNFDLYKEESILELNEFEFYCLIDLICDELINVNNRINEIKYLFKKRVQLIIHFLNNNQRMLMLNKLIIYLQNYLCDNNNNNNECYVNSILDFERYNE